MNIAILIPGLII